MPNVAPTDLRPVALLEAEVPPVGLARVVASPIAGELFDGAPVRLVVAADSGDFDVLDVTYARNDLFVSSEPRVPARIWAAGSSVPALPWRWAPCGLEFALRVENPSAMSRRFRAWLVRAEEQDPLCALVLRSSAPIAPGAEAWVRGQTYCPVRVERVQVPEGLITPHLTREGFGTIEQDPMGVRVAPGCEWGVRVGNRGPAGRVFVAVAWVRVEPWADRIHPVVRLAGKDAEVLRHDGEGRLLARCRDCGREGPLELDAVTDAALRRLCDKAGL